MNRIPTISRRARSISFAFVVTAWLVMSVVAAARAGDRPEPTPTTAISGVVQDALGARVPGATVVVTSTALAGEQVAITDESGAFVIDGLPVGIYTVTVYYVDGTWTRDDVTTAVGAVAIVHMTIDTNESFGEVITISGEAPAIDATSTSLGVSMSGSTSIESEYMTSIPVPGRSFSSVLGTAPGSAADSAQVQVPTAGLLTAATVGDADGFSAYVDFCDRHDGERDALGLSLDRRVRIRVVDTAQRAVNDAAIVVADGDGVRGRTHADGVWDYFPSDNASGSLAVSVEAGGARASHVVDVPASGRSDEFVIELDAAIGRIPEALDLAFAIDATGSMGDEMSYMSAELRDIVAAIRDAVPGVSIRVGAVIYRDRGDTVPLARRDFTADVDDFVDWLGTLSATGGGDTPEDMNLGLREAMNELVWRDGNVARVLVVLADAPPQDYEGADYRYPDAMRDAAARGIRLLPVAASSSDRTVEYLFRAMGVYTSTPYVYLTDDSGIGNPHLDADTDEVVVERFNDLLYRLVVADLRGEGMHPPGDWQSWADYRDPPWKRNPRRLVVGAGVGGGYLFDDTLAQLRWVRAGIAFGDLEVRAQFGWSSDLEMTPRTTVAKAGAGATPMAPIEVDMMIAGASLRYLFGDWRGVRAFTSAGLEALQVHTESLTDTTHLLMTQLGAEWRASSSDHGLAIGVEATSHLLLDSASRAADIAPLPPLELSVYADYRF